MIDKLTMNNYFSMFITELQDADVFIIENNFGKCYNINIKILALNQ